VPVVAGVVSVLTGSGAVAGSGAAGALSVGFACADEAASAVGVGAGSSFLDFLPLKIPFKALFIWSMASSAVEMGQIAKLREE
jgi:hypothetical protein